MKKNRNQQRINLIIHFLAWGLFLGSPLMFAGASGREINYLQYISSLGAPLSLIFVFYINYYLLVTNLLSKRRILLFIISNIGLVFLINFFQLFWSDFFSQFINEIPVRDRRFDMPPPREFFMLKDFFSVTFVATLSAAIKVTANLYKSENEKREMEKERSEAELKNLKNQLNPHFLFNTLNNIYSLIAINPIQAQQSVYGLSNLLRYVLYDNNEEMIPLSKELTFMKSYIDLMSIRLHEKVKLKIEISGEDSSLSIAPLLFITLIENAFKHGISPVSESFIDINISQSINKHNQPIVKCEISNSYFPKEDNDRSGSGIGLENLKKRLALIYPGKHSLVSKIENGVYYSSLLIDL